MPIGNGEIIRKVLGKAIAQIFGADICYAAASQQTCAGQEGGIEAAIHAAREKIQMESTEAVLLIDAENAFNRLNRQTAFLNIRHICPKICTYLFNTYRLPAGLFLGKGVEILSQEGTTQGENLAMAFYAPSLKKLLVSLNEIGCHQEWFARRPWEASSTP